MGFRGQGSSFSAWGLSYLGDSRNISGLPGIGRGVDFESRRVMVQDCMFRPRRQGPTMFLRTPVC